MIHTVTTVAQAAGVPVSTVRYHCAHGVMVGSVEFTATQWIIPEDVAARFIRAAHAARILSKRLPVTWDLCLSVDKGVEDGSMCTRKLDHRGGHCPGGVECDWQAAEPGPLDHNEAVCG